MDHPFTKYRGRGYEVKARRVGQRIYNHYVEVNGIYYGETMKDEACYLCVRIYGKKYWKLRKLFGKAST